MDQISIISDQAFAPASTAEPFAALAPGGFDALSGDGETCRLTIEGKRLKVDRMVGNLMCKISIPAAYYDYIALEVGEGSYSVSLTHRDPGLAMTIGDLPNLGAALDLRDDLARQLRLPAMTVSRDGEISMEETRLGSLIVRDKGERRASLATRRRPRFLAKRKSGHARRMDRFAGREIIART